MKQGLAGWAGRLAGWGHRSTLAGWDWDGAVLQTSQWTLTPRSFARSGKTFSPSAAVPRRPPP